MSDSASSVTTSTDGAIYIAGGIIDFGGQVYTGNTSAFFAKYTSDGTKVWTQLIGTSTLNYASSITNGSGSAIYLAGYTDGNLGGQINGGGYDAFLVKYGATNMDPTDITPSSSTFSENIAPGTAVATFTTTDPDSGDTFTYSLVSGTGSSDNSAFTIIGDKLLINATPNYEAKSSYSVRVRSTDVGGLYTEKAITLGVTDVKEAIRGNSFYTIVDGSAWTIAEANSVALGGHLVTINDPDERRWLSLNVYGNQDHIDRLQNGTQIIGDLDGYFVGLNDKSVNGVLEWSGDNNTSWTDPSQYVLANNIEFSAYIRNGFEYGAVHSNSNGLIPNILFDSGDSHSFYTASGIFYRGIAETPLTLSITRQGEVKEGAGVFTTSINLSAGTQSSGNLAEGAHVWWNVTGITADDLVSGALSGNGIITNGKLDFESSLKDDADTGETFDVSVYSDALMTQQIGATSSVAVKEASPVIRRNSLYKIVYGPYWTQAEEKAVQLGGHLTAVNSAEEENFLIANNGSNKFIGLQDSDYDGTWEWTNGDPVNYTHWHYGNPDRADASSYGWDLYRTGRTTFKQSYGWIWKDSIETAWDDQWNDNSGTQQGSAEIPLSLSITRQGVVKEGSGLFTTSINLSAGNQLSGNLAEGAKVWWKVTGITADDLVSGDLSGNGIIANGKLDIQHSLKVDSDAGENFEVSVFSDASMTSEYQIGTINSALAKEADPVIRGNSLYKVVDGHSWTQAEANSEAIGGYLVTIDNGDENTWIVRTYGDYGRSLVADSTGTKVLFIGLTRAEGTGTKIQGAGGYFDGWISGASSNYRPVYWGSGGAGDPDGTYTGMNWDIDPTLEGNWNDFPIWQHQGKGIAEIPLSLSITRQGEVKEGSGRFTTSINLDAGTLASGNLAEGALVWWKITGITADDLALNSEGLTGSGVITNGKLDLQHSLKVDADSGESFEISVFSDALMTSEFQIGTTMSAGINSDFSRTLPDQPGNQSNSLFDDPTNTLFVYNGGDDTYIADRGVDGLSVDFNQSETTLLKNIAGGYSLVTPSGTIKFYDFEYLYFKDASLTLDLSIHNRTLPDQPGNQSNSLFDDPTNTLFVYNGGDDTYIADRGVDGLSVDFNQSETTLLKNIAGGYSLVTPSGTIKFYDFEYLYFKDASLTLDLSIHNRTLPDQPGNQSNSLFDDPTNTLFVYNGGDDTYIADRGVDGLSVDFNQSETTLLKNIAGGYSLVTPSGTIKFYDFEYLYFKDASLTLDLSIHNRTLPDQPGNQSNSLFDDPTNTLFVYNGGDDTYIADRGVDGLSVDFNQSETTLLKNIAGGYSLVTPSGTIKFYDFEYLYFKDASLTLDLSIHNRTLPDQPGNQSNSLFDDPTNTLFVYNGGDDTYIADRGVDGLSVDFNQSETTLLKNIAGGYSLVTPSGTIKFYDFEYLYFKDASLTLDLSIHNRTLPDQPGNQSNSLFDDPTNTLFVYNGGDDTYIADRGVDGLSVDFNQSETTLEKKSSGAYALSTPAGAIEFYDIEYLYFMDKKVYLQNEPPVGTPTLSGTFRVGQTISIDAAAIQDGDNFAGYTPTYSYSWETSADNGGTWTPINTSDAADGNNTYTLVAGDVGKQIRGVVRYLDGHGTYEVVATDKSTVVTYPAVNYNENNYLIITAPGAGTIDAIPFSNTYSIDLGAGTDTATLTSAAGTNTGMTVAGGVGTDTLNGNESNNILILTGENQGTLDGLAFSGFENVDLKAGDDTVFILPGGSLTGLLNGGSGSRIVYLPPGGDPNTYVPGGGNGGGSGGGSGIPQPPTGDPITVPPAPPGFVVDGGYNSIYLNDNVNSITLTGPGSGVVDGTNFTNFYSVDLRGGNDSAEIQAGGSLPGLLDGGDGIDQLTLNSSGNTLVIDQSLNGTAAGTSIKNFESIDLSSGDDSAQITIDNLTGQSIVRKALTLDGGAGNDSLVLKITPQEVASLKSQVLYQSLKNYLLNPTGQTLNIALSSIDLTLTGFESGKFFNNEPYDITISRDRFDENMPITEAAATFGSGDVDSGDTFTYELVTGAGDADNGRFTVSGNSLFFTSSPDYETKSSYAVRLRTTDFGGLTFEKSFIFAINNIQEGGGTLSAITGTGAFNEGVTLLAGTVSGDPDGPAVNPAYSYQWYLGASAIGGATSSSYTVGPQGTGTYKVAVTYTDGQGYSTTLTSADQVVAKIDNGQGTVGPITSSTPGVFTEGMTLTSGTISGDPDGNGTITAYQWFRNGTAIGGATSASYVVPTGGAGTYTVRVSYSDGQGYPLTLTSAEKVVSSPPPLTDSTPPTLSSITTQGTTVILKFSEAVSAQSIPLGAFVVATVDSSNKATTRTISTVSLDSSDPTRVILTLSGTAPASTVNLRVSYTDPVDNQTTGVVQDTSGNDLASFSNRYADTFITGSATTLASQYQNLILTGAGNINGTGNALNNTITGNSGHNTLSGLTGADNMAGGLGNDTYVVDNVGDVVSEDLNAGTDTVQSSVTYTLGANVENLTLTGTAAINGTGNALNNVLTGNSAVNNLSGGAGDDTLIGGGGADILTGLAGADTFRIALADSRLAAFDRITDFAIGNDILDGPTAVTAANLRELGSVSALTATAIGAVLTTTNFARNSAATFSFGSGPSVRMFLAINDGTAGFSGTSDSLIEITGYSGSLTNLAIV